jgi:hypothetical protein
MMYLKIPYFYCFILIYIRKLYNKFTYAEENWVHSDNIYLRKKNHLTRKPKEWIFSRDVLKVKVKKSVCDEVSSRSNNSSILDFSASVTDL